MSCRIKGVDLFSLKVDIRSLELMRKKLGKR